MAGELELSFKKFDRFVWLVVVALWAQPLGASDGADVPGGGDAPGACSPRVLVLRTELGAMEVELLDDAAPEAVAWLDRLARGPLFHPDLVPPEEPASPTFYEGLSFDFTRPHVEIATATRPPSGLFHTPTRIDAGALGLDRETVADRAEAMSVLQRELLPELIRNRKRGYVTPRLRAWGDRWDAAHDPDFLIGVTRQEIAEALGYVYDEGLASPPSERGVVALWPESPRWSSARLTIFLADLPDRTGRWMAVGRVVAGLDVAEAISSRPLEAGPGYNANRPADPVTIDETDVVCRRTPEPTSGGPGGER